jgi:lysophospholipase L1-like esterase
MSGKCVRACLHSSPGQLLALLLVALTCPGLAPAGAATAAVPAGMVENPCPPDYEMPAALRTVLEDLFIEPRVLQPADFGRLATAPGFAEMEKSNRERAATDWAGLCRFRTDNARVAAGERPRVVLIGDSITENWSMADPGFFTQGIVNRGIGGQTSAQMLVRFRADVVALRPAAVHILAGTNDIAGNGGPTSPQDFRNNIQSMVELARANGIRVILGAIPPADQFTWRPGMQPAPVISAQNDWLRQYAARNGLGFIDYHAALVGPRQGLRAELGNDGVHPNRAGYRIMRKLVEEAL